MRQGAREAAFLALLSALREEGFISDSLNRWEGENRPPSRDIALAREIASGSCRMMRAIDFQLERIHGSSLSLKRKEHALLLTGAYQALYMDKIPHHALVNETVSLAKRYCHTSFARFANALLRALCREKAPLPEDIATRTSYPDLFVDQLTLQIGERRAEEILDELNSPSKVTARLRHGSAPPSGWSLLCESPFPTARLEGGAIRPEIADSPDLYIQNRTPMLLMAHLLHHQPVPNTILDLCAAPGGKALILADLFPEAALDLNDLSTVRCESLTSFLKKYSLSARLFNLSGERFESDRLYDLIVIDAPCSNSGVLHKRPEARWRLTQTQIDLHRQLQQSLLRRAVELLSPDGAILYMTCSILQWENEEVIDSIAELFPMTPCETIYPSSEGLDGGFAALLKRRHCATP